jgi:hypothetical protein
MKNLFRKYFLAIIMLFSCGFSFETQAASNLNLVWAFFTRYFGCGKKNAKSKKQESINFFNIFDESYKLLVQNFKVLKQYKTIWHGLLTCPAHAVKNAILGRKFLLASTKEEQNRIKKQMLAKNIFDQMFSGKKINNLKSDEILELIKSLNLSEDENANIKIITSFDEIQTFRDFDYGPSLLLQLAEPNYIISFIINTGGAKIVADNSDQELNSHWINCTVKKEEGQIQQIMYMDSLGSKVDEIIIKKLTELCDSKKEDILKKFKKYNKETSILEKLECCIESYNKRKKNSMMMLANDLDTLYEKICNDEYDHIQDDGTRLNKKLSRIEKFEIIFKLKEKNDLSNFDVNYLQYKFFPFDSEKLEKLDGVPLIFSEEVYRNLGFLYLDFRK